MNTQSFLFATGWLIILIDFCIALYKYKNLPIVLKAAAWFLVLVFIKQTAIFILLYQNQNNAFLFHIGVITDAVPLFLMYREMFKKHIEEKEVYVYRKIFIILIVFFVIFAVVNALFWQPLTTYPSITRTALNIVILFFSTLHFYKYTYEPIPKEPSELKDYVNSRVPLFWINTGLQFFTTATLILSIFGEVFLNSRKLVANNVNTTIVHAVFTIVLYTVIGFAFIKAKKLRNK